MSHLIYRTEAIVLGEVQSGDSGRVYFFFTKNLGFVAGIATGVRLLKSKLRLHLAPFSLVEAELIRGKNFWRVVNVYPLESAIFFRHPRAVFFAKLSGLVRRLVHGEEENKNLFENLKSIRSLIHENSLSDEEIKDLEAVSVARILSSLGYFGDKHYSVLSGEFNKNILPKVRIKRSDLIKEINSALRESHL